MTADEIQAMIDKDTVRVGKMIKHYGSLADKLCAEGQDEASSNVRETVGHLNFVIAIGRRTTCEIDGVTIKPLGGGK